MLQLGGRQSLQCSSSLNHTRVLQSAGCYIHQVLLHFSCDAVTLLFCLVAGEHT
jgi:hypothetical protein